jgi:acetoin utilization deacetylase AcuC-like enzyme
MTPAPVLLTHPSSHEHETGSHPERAERMTVIEQALREVDWCGYTRAHSWPCPEALLSAVHPGRYVSAIRELAEAGGGQIDADTAVSAGSWEAARHAAGGAVSLVRRVLAGDAPTGISIHRPPGHHAEPDRPMGFCLFNNVAVAARLAVDELGLQRVMIVDYDVHHGNGTNAVFHDDPRVLFVSVHQSPLWPGTGPLDDVGSGAGVGYSVNLPVAPGSGDAVFTGMIDGVAVALAEAFAPQLLLISAGFDAAAEDPLAECEVTTAGFAAMTASLRAVGASVGAPVAAVLEGGYSLTALGPAVVAAMTALGGSGSGVAGREWGPEVREAREFQSRWWPALSD